MFFDNFLFIFAYEQAQLNNETEKYYFHFRFAFNSVISLCFFFLLFRYGKFVCRTRAYSYSKTMTIGAYEIFQCLFSVIIMRGRKA